jgi:glycosyltransferase involved in cell wall biosynthesis
VKIIHFILGKANPDRMNGVNRVVYQLASHQAKAGFDVEVWGLTGNPIHDYPPRYFKTVLFKNRKIKWLLAAEAVNELKRLDPISTIFHLHGGFIPQHFAMSRLLLRYGIPYVLTPHGSYNRIAMRTSKLQKKIYVSLFEKSLVENAQAIHCLGKSEINGLKLFSSAKNVKLIPYGFENLTLQKRKDKNHQGGFVFGYCGRLDMRTKGLDIIITAFARFVRKHPSTLWLIGDGADKNKLLHLIRQENIENHIQWLGSKYRDEKSELIAAMDAFILASRNEGLPTSVLEAASLGVPCIISPETNLGDVLLRYDAGIVLDENSPEQLELAMLQLYHAKSNGRWQVMSENAIRMVAEAFDWNHVITEIQEMYA